MSLERTNVVMNSQNSNSDLNQEEDLLMSDFSINDLPNFTIDQLLDLDIPIIPKPAPKNNDSSDDMFGSDDDLLQALEQDPSWGVDNPQTQTQQVLDNIKKDDKNANDSIDSIDTHMSNLDLFKIESTHTSSPNVEHDMVPLNSEDVNMELVDEDISADICSQKLQSLDLVEEPNSSMQSAELIEQPTSSVQLDLTEKGIFSVQSTDLIEQPTVISIHSTKNSSSLSSRSSSPGISLRKRNAIQLQPFTLESEQFKKLFGRIATKSKLKDVVNIKLNLDDDDSDTDFTPFDTQRIDEPIDEITTQELKSLGVVKPSSNSKTVKKKSLDLPTDIATSSRPQENNTTKPTSSRTQETMASSSFSIPNKSSTPLVDPFKSNLKDIDYPEELQKYGLNKLIIPTKSKEKRKKAITFSTKRKKGKERSVSSRPTELPKTDIFAFDFNPKAVPTVDLNLISDDPDTESDEEVVFRRPRIKKRKVLISDSEDEDEEEEDMGEQMTEEEVNKIFEFPTEPLGTQHVQRNYMEESNSVSIIDDEYEYKDQKRQRIDIKDLQAKSLKNVLPASYLKLNEKKLEEELRNRKLAKSVRILSTKVSKKDKNRTFRNTEDVFAAFREDTDNESDNGVEYNNSIDRSSVDPSLSGIGRNDTIQIDQNKSFYYYDDPIFEYNDSINYDDDVIYDHGDSVDYGYDDNNILVNNNRMEYDNKVAYNDEMEYDNRTSHHGIIDYTDRPVNRGKIDKYFIPAYKNRISTPPITHADPPKLDLTPQDASSSNYIPGTSVDSTQAIEFNRISRQSTKSTGSDRNVQSTAKSSAVIVKPVISNTGRNKATNYSNAPKRKKKPRRTMDDIYVHRPYYTSCISNRNNTDGHRNNERNNYSVSSIFNYMNQPKENYRESNRNSNDNVFYKEASPQRAFDDIYMNTTRQSMHYKGDPIYIGNYDISDYLTRYVFHKDTNTRVPIIYNLNEITNRIRSLKEPNVDLIVGLRDTVYLHHRLIVPLISKNPKEKHTYSQFKETHSDLILFGKRFYWKQINSKQTDIIKDLFARVFQDILHLCSKKYSVHLDEHKELPNHDYFYTFVSLCLTQWIPILPSQDKTKLISLFIYLVRNLAYSVTKIIEVYHSEKIQWKPIVKLLLYLLDWTCRIELVDVNRSIWSVTEYSQLMLDILIYIGFESVKMNEYLVEAWICLILIVSVSNRKTGYHLNESIFLNQITNSIQQKSRTLSQYEFKKRRTTQYWAETLDYILNKYLML